MTEPSGPFNLIEADIEQVLDAQRRGEITSTWLTGRYLARIEAYDRGPGGLNAVPVLNPDALAEAAESDRRWREGTPRPLEGLPFTVKDSYMVKGLTVASGSPAFQSLMAQWDAFSVARLREAGAVLIGKTTMPPMADGGMQRGVYGRSESPYNRGFLPAAFASGSSNGSGVATAANLAVFGMGEETVSSGRSPASNNALCAYTPSWGVLSIRGNWPLYPTRDVVVPHTRSMPDMLRLLDVLVQDDPLTRGDFWRSQQAVRLPKPSEHRPESYLGLADADALRGRRFAVPAMYLGLDPRFGIELRPSVRALWERGRERLESLGAEVVVTGFPLIERYESDRPGQKFSASASLVPPEWLEREFTEFQAFGWDDFLRATGDPAFPSLAAVDSRAIFPQPPGALPDRYAGLEDHDDRFRQTVALAAAGVADPRETPGFPEGLRRLERLREELFEDWLTEHGFDGVVFPANADVGAADADRDPSAADRAWANGVLFSHGNHALRHLGIPTVTVALGLMADIGMPLGLTFAGPAQSDPALLAYASAFEAGGSGSLRRAPASTPALPGDRRAG